MRGANNPVSAEVLEEAYKGEGSQWGTTPVSDPENVFGDSEIVGNAFVFLLAGHETVANTLHFTFVLLAMNPSVQRDLQQSLDELFGDRPASEWDYDKDLPQLYYGMTGAVMNEELRLLAPVTGIPKRTPRDKPQHLTTVGGQKVLVPADCIVSLNTPGLHRNPAYWPRADENDVYDLLKFKPQRWFQNQNLGNKEGPAGPLHSDPEVGDAPTAQTWDSTSGAQARAPLFNPAKGAYIPFSEGARSCLGRRFAQVEALAVIAYVLKHYTIELDLSVIDPKLGEDASVYQERVKGSASASRSELWRKARERAIYHFENSMVSQITLQMQKGSVPIRLVRRGSEMLHTKETVVPSNTTW